MKERIISLTRVIEAVNQSFLWAGCVYIIKHISPVDKSWIVENTFTGRELRIR